jgi:hypothetical protein
LHLHIVDPSKVEPVKVDKTQRVSRAPHVDPGIVVSITLPVSHAEFVALEMEDTIINALVRSTRVRKEHVSVVSITISEMATEPPASALKKEEAHKILVEQARRHAGVCV